MRLFPKSEDDQAAAAAMRGGAIGAVKYCTVALFAGGVLQATWPKFAAVRPPQKMWLMVAAFLGGFGNGSDTAFTNFERRDRELQIKLANQKRHDILYGTDEERRQAAAAGVTLSGKLANTQKVTDTLASSTGDASSSSPAVEIPSIAPPAEK